MFLQRLHVSRAMLENLEYPSSGSAEQMCLPGRSEVDHALVIPSTLENS